MACSRILYLGQYLQFYTLNKGGIKVKNILKLGILVFIGIAVEMLGFLYLNNIFLEKKAVATFKSIEVNTDIYDEKVFKLPEKASNMQISFDNKYAVYKNGDNLEGYDIGGKSKINIAINSGIKVIGYDYMPYSDKLYMLEEVPKDGYYISIYDLKLKKEINHSPIFDYYFPSNMVQDNNMVQDDNYEGIKVSIEGSAFLIKQVKSDADNLIYIGEEFGEYNTKSDMPNIKIGEFFPLSSDWDFILQDSASGKIYNFYTPPEYYNTSNGSFIQAKKSITSISTEVLNPKLMYVDESDNIFIASEKNNKILELECKSLKDNKKPPKKYYLKNPVQEDNIRFLQDGNVYVLEKGQLRNLKNNKITKYNGEFIKVQEGKLFYSKNGYVMEKSML